MAMDTAAALDFEEERPRIELDTNEGATPSGRGAPPAGVSSATVERDSNGGLAEALPVGSVYPPPVETSVGYQSQVDYSHPSNAYLHSGQVGNGQPAAYNPSAQPYPVQSQMYTAPEYQAQFLAQGNVWQPDGAMNEAQAGQPMDLLTAKLMEEEGRRMRRGGAQGPQLVEVRQQHHLLALSVVSFIFLAEVFGVLNSNNVVIEAFQGTLRRWGVVGNYSPLFKQLLKRDRAFVF
jgi:hypothetical protein